ncbi:NADPH-dependent F420 reductase [Streptomyces ipomoeae]|uniref:NADP oxidoreductase coenzyme F420-dependent n=2 Tax=Streptomyces ipomoeae TaxID=103232 RepID=L1L8E4_9ACTN|nr:NAD(P)-binding domain-containing protein [Streptomyces ipomoeae]EKX69197.1 NADP oxidoreductase coenzyme F420-dependent [Streptomyces ipomoeae 91-03]MDX2700860.1 NAD(P)-binding domain-containing protein [Streptomyces ipomoeae]MDX2846505.1 NAD(P)-binding domain-containing protein [Streptomyces ipomoeae]MDX2881044.1 NAD(P)-binding domain-containing protein [Streptomyces ipomoeae]TQE22132.1 oxidoreductase [Streptomyces ipomoeae]
MAKPQTLGLIGSGMIGGAVARLAVAAGLDVVLSNSRGPETLAELVEELGDRARAATPAEAARTGDLVVATIPLHAYERLSAADLAGKTVIDTMNYYPDRDGRLAELDAGDLTSSALVQRHLAESYVVKAFNNIDFRRLFTSARPAGAADRSALPIAGDHAAAKAEVTRLLDVLGYDAVDLGTLADSWRSEPGTPVYVQPYLAERPAGLSQEEAGRWFFETPGVPLPVARVKELIDAAVRLPAGSARMGLADD